MSTELKIGEIVSALEGAGHTIEGDLTKLMSEGLEAVHVDELHEKFTEIMKDVEGVNPQEALGGLLSNIEGLLGGAPAAGAAAGKADATESCACGCDEHAAADAAPAEGCGCGSAE